MEKMTKAKQRAIEEYPAECWKEGKIAQHIQELHYREAFEKGYEKAISDAEEYLLKNMAGDGYGWKEYIKEFKENINKIN